MTASRRFTVSLPEKLFEFGERERNRRNVTRSRFVAELYLEALRARTEALRASHYAGAFSQCPETEEEREIAEAAAALLGQ